ncbi:DUF1266 domain-containing protein [Paenibacillus sp. RC67]|uniref:DUF1266 domain-containing protein n=1 Tax=Paenibacillus sp. RC67 TaxID=3039392 RepID=UPI0024AD6B6B|nr:DUF1266 domain-containing protein [Paenibacillus sp. RC67]
MTTEKQSLLDSPSGLWCFALDATMNEMNGLSMENNYKLDPAEDSIDRHKHSLSRDWGIQGQNDLLRRLESLMENGHRAEFHQIKSFLSTLSEADQHRYIQSLSKTSEKYRQYQIVKAYMDRLPTAGIAAWDWGRYVHLCKVGIFVEYLTEEKALRLVKPVAVKAQQQYDGWQQFGIAFLAGRQFWWGQMTGDSAEMMAGFARNLVIHPNSLWNRLNWNLQLDV